MVSSKQHWIKRRFHILVNIVNTKAIRILNSVHNAVKMIMATGLTIARIAINYPTVNTIFVRIAEMGSLTEKYRAHQSSVKLPDFLQGRTKISLMLSRMKQMFYIYSITTACRRTKQNPMRLPGISPARRAYFSSP